MLNTSATFIFILSLYQIWTRGCTDKQTFVDTFEIELGVRDWESLAKRFVEVGKGNFGTVYRIPFSSAGFAVLKKLSISNANERKKALEEVARHAKLLKHESVRDFIPALYGCVNEGSEFYIIMEHIPYSFEYSIENPQKKDSLMLNPSFVEFWKFDEHVRFAYYKLMLEGLQKIHQAGFVLNDIKPGNILYSTFPDMAIKFIDFGFTGGLNEFPLGGSQFYNDVPKIEFFRRHKASSEYEQQAIRNEYSNRNDNYMTDIWGLALTIYQVELPAWQPRINQSLYSNWRLMDSTQIADKIRQDKWIKNRNINFCTKENRQPRICFLDVLGKMTDVTRDLLPDIIESYKLNGKPKGDKIMMTDLVTEMQMIYEDNEEQFEQPLKEFRSRAVKTEAKRTLLNIVPRENIEQSVSDQIEIPFDSSVEYRFYSEQILI